MVYLWWGQGVKPQPIGGGVGVSNQPWCWMFLTERRLVPFIWKLLTRKMVIRNLHKIVARDKQKQTRLQGANWSLIKGYGYNGFTSLHKANQTWNIPLTSLSNHLISKTRFKKHGPPSVLKHEEDITIVG
jgi:hypothetical protein